MNMIIEFLFGRIARALDGYKTTIGAVGLILLGVVGLIGHYWPDSGCPAMTPDSAMGSVAGGLVAMGIGGKMEKVIKK